MSYMASITKAEPAAIQPRDRRFSRQPLASRWWLNGDPVATAFYNAMSASFPVGEAFFVETLRYFKGAAAPELKAEIEAFIKQEVVHSREHLALNRRVAEAGYDIKPLEDRPAQRLALLREKGPMAGLVGTMALEHITAIFAHEVLANRHHMQGADPEIAHLWRWHCLEEIEHKAVAFDTWLSVTRDWSKWKRWWTRSKVMVFITRRFLYDRLCGMLELLRQDGLSGPRILIAVFWFSLARPGMVRHIFQGWARYFKPGFHPWDHDDLHLIEQAADAA